MSKKHLKRINAPKTWNINKKINKYIRRPNPGAHKFEEGMPLSILIKDVLNLAKTHKEVKNILNKNDILVDGIKRREPKFIVGFMDVITVPLLKENFRVIINNKGKLDVIKIDDSEAKLKICRLNGKTMYSKKVQLNLSDGRNILSDKKDMNVGDSILISLPNQEIKDVLKLDRGSLVILMGGKNIGNIASVEEIKDQIMRCRKDEVVFETSKKYAFVVGKDKSIIKV